MRPTKISKTAINNPQPSNQQPSRSRPFSNPHLTSHNPQPTAHPTSHCPSAPLLTIPTAPGGFLTLFTLHYSSLGQQHAASENSDKPPAIDHLRATVLVDLLDPSTAECRQVCRWIFWAIPKSGIQKVSQLGSSAFCNRGHSGQRRAESANFAARACLRCDSRRRVFSATLITNYWPTSSRATRDAQFLATQLVPMRPSHFSVPICRQLPHAPDIESIFLHVNLVINPIFWASKPLTAIITPDHNYQRALENTVDFNTSVVTIAPFVSHFACALSHSLIQQD